MSNDDKTTVPTPEELQDELACMVDRQDELEQLVKISSDALADFVGMMRPLLPPLPGVRWPREAAGMPPFVPGDAGEQGVPGEVPRSWGEDLEVATGRVSPEMLAAEIVKVRAEVARLRKEVGERRADAEALTEEADSLESWADYWGARQGLEVQSS